jgi:DsbC/DsbD-like thiol-disulfide interchange protein
MRFFLGMAMIVLMSISSISAQILAPVKWSYESKKTGKDEAVILLKATIEGGWHIYSQKVGDGGPLKTTFSFLPSPHYSLIGKVAEPAPIKKYEKSFKMEVQYFEKSVIFQQRVAVKGNTPLVVEGELEFMACSDEKCLAPEEVEFSVAIK